MSANSERRGFALLAALLAIILISALLTATAFKADESTLVSRLATLRYSAFTGSESALWRGIGSLDPVALRAMQIGESSTSTSVGQGLSTKLTVTRTDSTIYWITASAEARRGAYVARHRIGVSGTMGLSVADTVVQLVPGRPWIDLY